MKKSDRRLGMHRDITRRDFIHDLSLASLGLTLNPGALAGETLGRAESATEYYPPVRTGMRGSHPGSFELAHALAIEGSRAISVARKMMGATFGFDAEAGTMTPAS